MRIACEECSAEYDTENPALNPVCSDCAAEDQRAMERVDRHLADHAAQLAAYQAMRTAAAAIRKAQQPNLSSAEKRRQTLQRKASAVNPASASRGHKVRKEHIPWMDPD